MFYKNFHRLERDVRQMENNNDGSDGFLSGFYTARQDCKISSCVRVLLYYIWRPSSDTIDIECSTLLAGAGGYNCNVVDDSHNIYSQCKTSSVSLFSRVGPGRE